MSKSTQLLGCAVLALALTVPDLAWAQAVPRGSSSSSGSSGSGSGSSSGGSGGSGSTSSPPVRTAAPRSAPSPSRQPASSAGTSRQGVSVPPGSRDSTGRVITGGAIPRTSVPGYNFYRPVVWYPWYGSSLNWYFGFGSYSPFFYGSSWGLYGAWYNPYASLGYGPYYDPWLYPYGYGGYGAYSIYPPGDVPDASPERQYATGSVRVRVKPSSGKVYLDGTFMGAVDQFDGFTDHLAVPAGRHEIEIRADGYETLTLPVDVQPDKTMTVRGSLTKR